MHAVFMPTGIVSEVEHLKKEMECQKFKLIITSPDKKETKEIWIQGLLRIGAFGVWEYVFPREYLDVVLTTLTFHERAYSKKIGNTRYNLLRKILACDKIPKFKTDSKLLWLKTNVAFIPIGVRYDRDIEENEGELKGWTHEGI